MWSRRRGRRKRGRGVKEAKKWVISGSVEDGEKRVERVEGGAEE